MNRAAAILLYVMLALWLAGFGAAAVTAGAPAAVVAGTAGLLGTLAVAAARIARGAR